MGRRHKRTLAERQASFRTRMGRSMSLPSWCPSRAFGPVDDGLVLAVPRQQREKASHLPPPTAAVSSPG